MNAARAVVAIAVLGYLGVSLWSGWAGVVDAAKQIGVLGILVGILLMLANIVLRFMRWQLYLRSLGYAVHRMESLRVFVAGFSIAITPGGVGEPVMRGFFLKRFGAGFPQIFAAYAAERIIDVICVMVLALAGLLTYPAARPAVAIVAVIIAVGIWVTRQDLWLGRIRTLLQARGGRVGRLAVHGVEVVLQSNRFFTGSLFARGLLLGLAAWILTAACFCYIVFLVGSDIGPQTAVFIYSFSILVGALTFLPGGLGSAEATMIGLLLLNGMPQGQAVAVTILSRMVTLWFSVALGVWCLYMPPQGVDPDENPSVPR